MIDNGFVESEPNKPAVVGDTITFACDEFYNMDGSPRITCTEHANWTTNPICVPGIPILLNMSLTVILLFCRCCYQSIIFKT